MSSMEAKSRLRWILLTAIAPLAWGSVYVTTRQLLPPDSPLWGSVFRAVPAAIILLLVSRKLPRGQWIWRSFVLGFLTVGGFFALIYVAGTTLPSGVAATLMSTSAVGMLLFGWALLSQRPKLMPVAGAVTGIAGVAIMVGASFSEINPWGVLASLGAMTASTLGFVLTARWGGGIAPVTLASWQLMTGSVVIVVLAVVFEGPPPMLTGSEIAGFAYISVVCTALAYFAWFTGLRHLPAAAVGAIGLLNPVSGVVLGVLIAGEPFGLSQAAGMALVIAGVAIALSRSHTPQHRATALTAASAQPSEPASAQPSEPASATSTAPATARES